MSVVSIAWILILVGHPIFATLSLVGLWCVARRLGGVHAAWLAATLTAVSLPQIWFSKLSVPETVAQCFVMAGVLAWLVACARGATRWALAAGWFLGLACFAKVDLLVLLPVFLLAVVAARLLTRARFGDPPLLLALLAAFGLVVAHNFVHYLSFATHYRPYVAYLIQTSSVLTLLRDSALVQAGAALAAGLLAAAGVAALRRPAWRWPWWCWGWAAVAALVAYGVNYVTTTAGRLDETIVWLSWYVSWPVLGLAALGLTGLVRVRRTDAAPGLAVVGLLLGVVGLQYLYDPLETGLQMESMRRYVPVVLPLTMLFGALTVVTLLARVASRYRLGLTLATGALLVGLVARPSLAVVGQPLWDEALAQTAQVARLFPDQAVVLVSPDLADTHIQTSLAYLHDVDAILVQERNPDGQVLRRVISGWLARGRAVFVVVGQQEFSFFAPDFELAAVERAHIDLYTLERTRTRAPQAVVSTPIRLQPFQVTRTSGPARTAIDVGTPADDLLYDLQGFHGPERDGDPDRGTFRWTGPQASLTLPRGGGRHARRRGHPPARHPPGRDLGVDRGAAGRKAGARRDPTDDPVGPAGDRRPGPDRPHDSVDGVQPAVPRPVVRPARSRRPPVSRGGRTAPRAARAMTGGQWPHLPGHGYHGVSAQRRHARARTGDRGAGEPAHVASDEMICVCKGNPL